jgi:hypothetical protein
MWYAAATSFVPYHDAIQADLYSNANARVRFKDGKVGTIFMTHSVDQRLPVQQLWLHLTYQFTPVNVGPRSPFVVTAALRRLVRTTGHVETIVGITSDSRPTGATDKIQRLRPPSPIDPAKLSWENEFYFVLLGLRRDATHWKAADQDLPMNPTAFGVSISSSSAD